MEDRVSRTQYQYTLEDPDQNELNLWTAALRRQAQGGAGIARCRDRPADRGLAAKLVIDRQTASRMGISPQAIDETLYDGFGQRQISTLYTQLNQYHIILETMPSFQRHPDDLHDIYVRSGVGAHRHRRSTGTARLRSVTAGSGGKFRGSFGYLAPDRANPPAVTAANGGAVPLNVISHFESASSPLSINHQGQFPVVTISFNLAPGASLGRRDRRDRQGAAGDEADGMPISIQSAFQGTAASFQASLSNEPLLILAAVVTVYIVLGCSMKATSTR